MKNVIFIFILFMLTSPINTYAFGGSSVSINVHGNNGSFRYSQQNYIRTIDHRVAIRHHRNRGDTRGYHQKYRQNYRHGYREGYEDGFYNSSRPIVYSEGKACWGLHSPAALRREAYVSERAHYYGRRW
jgi:hypothetical protein